MLIVFYENYSWFNLNRSPVLQNFNELERFQDPDPLVRMAVDKCADNFEDLGTDFGSKIEPKYLLMVLERLHEKGFKFSRGVDYVSEIVLQNCMAYPQMEERTFLNLTDVTFLPTLPGSILYKARYPATRLMLILMAINCLT